MSNTAKRALSHSSIYAIGNISRQLAGFIMLPIYTRHLSPTDYGVVGLLLSVMALVEVFFGARLGLAVPKFYFDENTTQQKNSVISTALMVTGLASLITMIVLISVRDVSSQLLFSSINYGNAIGLFSTLILTQAIENHAMTYIRIQQRPWLFISISLTKLVLQLSLNIWLVVYEKMGVTGVALSSAASSSLFALGLTIYTFKQTGRVFCKEQAQRMLKFCWPLWLSGLAGLYIGSANRYFINQFSSTSDVGLFELASKFSAILTLIVWEPFQQYWQTERFKIYHQENALIIFKTAFQGISTLLAIGALGIGLFSEPVIRIMAAPAFQDAARVVPFLAIGVMFSSLGAFANFSFFVKEKTFWLTRNNFMTAGIITALFFLLVPKLGATGAASAGLIASGIQFLIIFFAGRRIYDMNLPLRLPFIHLGIITAGLVAAFLFKRENIAALIGINSIIFLICSGCLIAVSVKQSALTGYMLNLLKNKIAKHR